MILIWITYAYMFWQVYKCDVFFFLHRLSIKFMPLMANYMMGKSACNLYILNENIENLISILSSSRHVIISIRCTFFFCVCNVFRYKWWLLVLLLLCVCSVIVNSGGGALLTQYICCFLLRQTILTIILFLDFH